MNKEKKTKKKTKMKKWQMILLIVLAAILALLLTAAVALYALFAHYYNKLDYAPLEDHTETIVYDIEDETDWPLEDGSSDAPPTQTVTDAQGSQLPPVTAPPVTEDPKVEAEVKDNIDQNVKNEPDLIKVGKNVKNILLIGTDGRTTKERGRSDSMILLTINENTKEITMTSFMRDIYLYIPEVNTYNRINASYAYGGVPLLINTIKQNFRLEIDQYVRVNFDSFRYIVDCLGGVDIELNQKEIDYIGMTGQATPGMVHLNGAQALAYCRCRYVPKGNLDGDFARTARQREFLEIMSQKLKGLSVSELTELLDIFLPYVTTNLTQGDILGLLANCAKYLDYDIKSERLPVSGSWKYATIRRMSVLSVDFDKNIKALEKIVGGN